VVCRVEEGYRLRVFKDRVLRKVVGPKRDEVIGKLRRLYSEELYDIYLSANFIEVIKSRRMRWMGM
jgi:hypothetical protein